MEKTNCCDDNELKILNHPKMVSIDLNKYLSSQLKSSLPTLNKLLQAHPPSSDTPPVPSKSLPLTVNSKSSSFYRAPKIIDSKPWRTNPHHFRTLHISLLALIKITTHAISGGPLEIMGMLTGYYSGSDLIVLDVYPLPVHGTETRVNPLNESYEFMLQYLSDLQKNSTNKNENIIGWYHSHPGFGCWLSGIDVQTQRLNQGFQDPYVAIVIDPVKSLRDGKIDIGAFRTYYEDNKPESTNGEGWHGGEYYALDVKLFRNEKDDEVLKNLSGLKFTELIVKGDDNDDEDLANWKNICESLKGINTNDVIVKKLKTKRSGIPENNDAEEEIADDDCEQQSQIEKVEVLKTYSRSSNELTTGVSLGSTVIEDKSKKCRFYKGNVELNKLAKEELNRFMVREIQENLFL